VTIIWIHLLYLFKKKKGERSEILVPKGKYRFVPPEEKKGAETVIQDRVSL